MTARTFCESVLVDETTKDVYFDGVPFPHWLAEPGPQIERGIDGSRYHQVTITVWTERVLVLQSLEEDLAWIRALGKKQREEALQERKRLYEKRQFAQAREWIG
jgi:hypothetical protein